MKAMILAAGHGVRMRPLTDHTPKPLLEAGGKPLIVWHIEKLAQAGFREIVINIAWLGWMIPEALGDGARWGVQLHYSDEQAEGALETAGGIIKALPLLGDAPFLIVNGDVWCDYPCLPQAPPDGFLAHLVMVPNPVQHPEGDFSLQDGRVALNGEPRYTYSGISCYHPAFFAGTGPGKRPMLPLWQAAIARGQVSGELYRGTWMDIGTPERLAQLSACLAQTV